MKGYETRTFEGIPLGLTVRRSIGTTWIYRVRRGRGIYGEKLGEIIQDRYAYFVPNSITNAESEPYRRQWIAAVAAWQALTEPTKTWWNNEVKRLRLVMSGYNLFIRKAMKGEIGMFVDRGVAADYDYVIGDLDLGAGWHEMDFSAVAPVGTKALLFRAILRANVAEAYFQIKEFDQAPSKNVAIISAGVANIWDRQDIICPCNADRKVQYNFSAGVTNAFGIVVKGWWT